MFHVICYMKFEMKSIFTQVKQWFISHQADIILVIGVILVSLLSFAMGYITAKQQEKEPIRIEQYYYQQFVI